jgi:hypothetical protein
VVNQPATDATSTDAVSYDVLEAEAIRWEGYADELQRRQEELGDWRGKSEDGYRLAAAVVDAEPPELFLSILEQVRALA